KAALPAALNGLLGLRGSHQNFLQVTGGVATPADTIEFFSETGDGRPEVETSITDGEPSGFEERGNGVLEPLGEKELPCELPSTCSSSGSPPQKCFSTRLISFRLTGFAVKKFIPASIHCVTFAL